MKPPIILTVTSVLSLVCGVCQALPANPPHHLEPNAPRSITVSEAQTPPVIRAGLLQSTLILLPAEEKIATVFGGDTVDWVFDAGHVASRFISVKPKLANTTKDIYLGGVKMRPRLALPVDITEGKTTLPDGRVMAVALAPLATAQGYRWYFRAPERKFYDASMHRWLRDAVYGGKGLLELFELSLIEGGVCLAAMLWFSVPSDIKRFRVLKYGRVLRGPVMMTPSEFNDAQRAAERKMLSPESLRKLSCKLRRKEPPPPAMGIGFKTTECRELMRIPARKEAQHIQIIGDTGTGKSQLIMQILRQIRDRGEAAIVYDPATEFVKRFYDEERGDVVLNPLDARCPFWSPANEIERNAEAVTIAASLYQPTSMSVKDEFFYRTPAQIFSHLLKTGPTPHELAAWMADEAELQRLVAGTEMAHYINRKAGPQATGVLSSLALVAQSLRLLPRQEDAPYLWNATDWAQERKGWIFVTSKNTEREVLRPLHSLWIDILVMRLLKRPKPGQKKVWFVIDELASLQRLPQLHTAITESRKSKNPLVLGFQGKAQLEDIRAFGTQLLCEQVIGRALRRQSYDLNEEGLFNVEYADILGIPFDFAAKPVVVAAMPPRQTIQVKAVRPERDALEIRFPRVMGYRVELPNERLTAKFTEDSKLNLTPELTGPSQTQNSGIVGESVNLTVSHLRDTRPSTVLYNLTTHLLYTKWRDPGEEARLHLFGQLKRIVKEWLDTCLICRGDTYPAQILYRHLADMAAERITAAINSEAADRATIKALLDPFNPVGSSRHVNFTTSKATRYETDARRCQINWVILDSDWEAEFCRVAENHPRVRRYVKNHNLGFDVPYRYGSESRIYRPDFIVLIEDGHGEDDLLHLVVEIKGYRREDAKDKKLTMETYWIPGVNASGSFASLIEGEFQKMVESVTEPQPVQQ
jgi:hypothetical protein